MSIDKQFSRQIRQIERIPQRALYRQTRVLTKGVEKSMLKGFSKAPAKTNTGGLAKEILWFFSSLVIAILIAFLIFYLVSHFLEELLYLGTKVTGSVYNFYYLLFSTCFIGIYVIRVINWAIKMITLKK